MGKILNFRKKFKIFSSGFYVSFQNFGQFNDGQNFPKFCKIEKSEFFVNLKNFEKPWAKYQFLALNLKSIKIDLLPNSNFWQGLTIFGKISNFNKKFKI